MRVLLFSPMAMDAAALPPMPNMLAKAMNKIKIGYLQGIAGLSDEERVRHVVDDGDQTADDAGDRHFGDGPGDGHGFH